MKYFKFLSLFLGMMVATTAFVACGDDDDKPNNTPSGNQGETPSANDLVGTWSLNGVTYIFTDTQLTIKMMNYQTQKEEPTFEGTYSYTDGRITYYVQDSIKTTAKVKFLYDKSVLVLRTTPDNPDDYSLSEVAEVLYKDGKAPNTPVSDIQGTWHWYMKGNTEYIRAGVKINGDNIEIIITPWAERHVGTFTYSGGVLHLNTTEFYSGRGEHGYGDGNGGINPATLECSNWIPCSAEDLKDHLPAEMQFISDGTEAYGFVAGLPAIFVKK